MTERKRVLDMPWATVWVNGVWHTWDHNGEGGENSSRTTVLNAIIEAIEAAISQGFVEINEETLEVVQTLQRKLNARYSKSN